MKNFPILIFFAIILSSFCAGMRSYSHTARRIAEDVDNALSQTLATMPGDVVTTDTIRCYRNHLTIAALKDTASISMRIVRRRGKLETMLVADANCDLLTVVRLSDQRASGSLLAIGLLWLLGNLWYARKRKPQAVGVALSYGGIVYTGDRFTTSSGTPIRLTPMQHSLLEMFMLSDDHTLSKQEICDRLWPKKPDANATLYTLIRRIRPLVEAYSDLKIESDRGKSYALKHR